MPSLKLSNPFRRGADRPSLKQRAAALKATAGRAMKQTKPRTSAEIVAAMAPHHPGFVPYPHGAPTQFLAVDSMIRLEARRLLEAAEAEFDRLYEAQGQGLDSARSDAFADRLRGELRISALTEAAADEDPAPPVDWHNPPPGFMAYPAIEPQAFANIRLGLRLEAERLLVIASAEFDRQMEGFRPHHPGQREADMSAHLRRVLRVDELAAAASPERAEPAGDDRFQPGFVLYEDAAGTTHRRPVADWIGFMAQRLYAVARQEQSRAFNIESRELTQGECRPIEDRLRRDLRLDALHDLAHRWEDIFEVSREYGVGGRWRQENVKAPLHDLLGYALPELARLYETWEGVHMHLSGASAVPCFSESNNGDFRPAGEALESECERAGGFLDAIAQEARKRTPECQGERNERLNVLVRHEMNTNGRPASAALLAELVAAAKA